MKGETLKTILEKCGYTKTYIAEKLGVPPQNIQTWFKADDVKTGTIERLAEVLDKPIAFFYGDAYTITGNNNATAINNSTATSSDDRLISLLVSKDEQLTLAMRQTSKAQEQIDRLLEKIVG